MKFMITIAIVSLMSTFAIFAQGGGIKRIEGIIRGLDGELEVAFLKGDTASVDRILADDYTEITSQGLLKHKTDVIAIVRARASAPSAQSVGPEVTIDETKFRTYGDTVVLIGRTTTRYQFMEYQTSPDTTQSAAPVNTDQEWFMKVYSRRDGRWQLVASTRTAIAKR